MRFILLLFLLISFSISAQEVKDQDWNGFYQRLDAKNFRGGRFKLTAFVKTEYADNDSQARLLARVTNDKGHGFFDNMVDRPITSKTWTEYTIEGDISQTANSLLVGGLYFGFGRYFYDDFKVEIRTSTSDWTLIPLVNGDFEGQNILDGWREYFKVNGYVFSFSTVEPHGGTQSFLVDGMKRSELSFGHNRAAGKFIKANGIIIYYEEYGVGEPLLLLHGNGESINSFKFQIPELSKNFRVIAMDSRGQGRTSENGEKLSYELMAEDVSAFLDSAGIKKTHVLGWSDGGNTGLILAMKYSNKVDRLAIMGANLFNDKSSVDQHINRTFETLRNNLKKDGSSGAKFKIQLIDLALNEPKINPGQLKTITCPTLVMAGSKDIIKEGHTKLLASNISKSKLVIFERGTHYEPMENPGRFNKEVIEFLLH